MKKGTAEPRELARRRKAAIGKAGSRRNGHPRNRCGSWPTCQFRQDDGPRDEANTSEESKEAVRLGRPPHIANSMTLIAPPERISVAAMYSTYIQPGPAMAASVGWVSAVGLTYVKEKRQPTEAASLHRFKSNDANWAFPPPPYYSRRAPLPSLLPHHRPRTSGCADRECALRA